MALFILRGLPLYEQEQPKFLWFSWVAETAQEAVKQAQKEGAYGEISIVGMVLTGGKKGSIAFDPLYLAWLEKEGKLGR